MSITSTVQTRYVATIDLGDEDFYHEIKLNNKFRYLLFNALPKLNNEKEDYDERVEEHWYSEPIIVFESLSKERCDMFIKVWEEFLKPEKEKWCSFKRIIEKRNKEHKCNK